MSYSICEFCGSCHHWQWEEAFHKFGFGDGDGMVMTEIVADALRNAGLVVAVEAWGMHNVVITAIARDGIHLIPEDAKLGFDDPRDYLPPDIVALLDRAFPDNREV